MGDLPVGRVFHSALLLPGAVEGPYDIWLTGGLVSQEHHTLFQPVVVVGDKDAPFPLVPGPGAAPAPSVLIRYFPWADPPQVQQLAGSPQLESRIFPAVAKTENHTILVGGAKGYASLAFTFQDHVEVVKHGPPVVHQGPFPLLQSRVGAMAAVFSNNQILVYGGNLGSSAPEINTKAMELVQLDPVKSVAAVVEADSVGRIVSSAHGTLTPTVNQDLLLVGGFTVEPGKARSLREKRPVLRLSRVKNEIRVTEVKTTGFVTVAYHAAVALREDVIVSGGTTAACPTKGLCGTAGIFRYQSQSDALVAQSLLHVPRMGHCMTLLLDGTMLITGGLSHAGSELLATTAAELYAPAMTDLWGRTGTMLSTKPCAQ